MTTSDLPAASLPTQAPQATQATQAFPPAPLLLAMCRIVCEVEDLVTLGQATFGERRFVPLGGGTVSGPEFSGTVVPGGVDWQVRRQDGTLDIQAHYVLKHDDGSLVEIQSSGLRHGPAAVMERLARGEAVGRDEYFFRTLVRFTTGAPAWRHLNDTMAIAVGSREARRVLLDVYRLT
ncbi:MAG: hypothetical protein JWQ11_769 [Rhizobacter sp.]|nr:hypothetical protein [Rhizobacter sp.]